MYKSIPACTSNGAPGTPGNRLLHRRRHVPGTHGREPRIQADTTSFYQDTPRETKQTAFFASVDFDLIPKVLTLTAGTRHFLLRQLSEGSVIVAVSAASRRARRRAAATIGSYSYNLDAQNLRDTESGFKSRANLTWHIMPDVMVYYTWSQGFRPGGFNQNGGTQHAYGPDGSAAIRDLPHSYHIGRA